MGSLILLGLTQGFRGGGAGTISPAFMQAIYNLGQLIVKGFLRDDQDFGFWHLRSGIADANKNPS